MEENAFLQDILEPQITTQFPMNDDVTETNVKELIKPSPRYGHAACRYEGTSHLLNFLNIIRKNYKLNDCFLFYFSNRRFRDLWW